MNEDFVDSLLYEIKQEIIDNFFAERRLLEEEREACGELMEEQAKRLSRLRRSQARLARLLLDEAGLAAFGAMVGQEPTRFAPRSLSPGEPCLFKCRPRGLTLGSRYGALLVAAYEEYERQARKLAQGQEELEASVRAYNEDVDHYRRNFDVMTIVEVLGRMDPEEIERRHWLGENFSAEEKASLADTLTIRHLAVPEELRGAACPLPEPKELRSQLRLLAKELCRRRPEEAKAELARFLD